MTARPVPVVVGTGLIAAAHMAALRGLGAHDVIVWSPDPDKRARFADRWGATAAPSLEAAIASPSATSVHVCSPPMQHLEPIELAARRGLTMVSEKPLAPTRELACRALDAVAAGGGSAWLGFQRRLDAGVVAMRAAVTDGEVGRPVSVSGHYRQQWNAEPSGLDWRLDPAFVGPSRTPTEIGSHWFDLLTFVLDSRIVGVCSQLASMGPRSVVSESGTATLDPPNDDVFTALLRLENGVVGAVYGTELAHGSFDEIELRVDGTRGSAIWDSAHPGLVRVGDKVGGIRARGTDTPSSAVSAFIEAVYEERAAELGVATFADGVANAAVLDAVRRSAHAGAWVEVEA